MKEYLRKDPWKIIEESFNESSYISGIYYPDKTRVGWWKNGYPEYFAKVLNSINWIGINLSVDGQLLDLDKCKILEFRRELDMRHSLYTRQITLKTALGVLQINSERFCNQVTKELGVIKYTVSSETYEGPITIESYLDADVRNQDSNYDESFWDITDQDGLGYSSVSATTKKTKFEVQASMYNMVDSHQPKVTSSKGRCAESYTLILAKGQSVTLHKYVSIATSFHHGEKLAATNSERLKEVQSSSYNAILDAHKSSWENNWKNNDIEIIGDVAAQQGMRFNILQLYQTYDGSDDRLNIGPKGYTGEKYGGCTYWDTEAYCLPFYLSTSEPAVARSLLVYRYNHLAKAIENAEKLGFKDGAALYPMVTMNGEECHNEWEITFEEIHRNGAIAYAIYNYIEYTGDKSYLSEYGLEVLLGIARFWSQRFQYSESKKAYVMLGVTGPNEYENNVNNNWYTNYIGRWCIEYCKDVIEELALENPNRLQQILEKVEFKESERGRWNDIIDNTYLPYDEDRKVFLQQDGFLDKQLRPVTELSDDEIPIHQNWSWDRILRFKQADVLQGMYFFENDFDLETLQRNFDFYEPMTVHESSLSPCIHAVLACRLGDYKKAHEMYLRTARLDLDDYNNDTEDGLHITSMAGTWLAIVKGFGGMKLDKGVLSLSPVLPEQWESLSFRIVYRGSILKISISKSDGTQIENISSKEIKIYVYDRLTSIDANQVQHITS